MSRGGGGSRTRVKTARGRTTSSNRWLARQLNDPYVKRAHAEGYRSRAAYKLIELDERFTFLRGIKNVVDLGIAPGGWAQVVRKRCPKAKVIGIDLLPVDPIDGVFIAQMDFTTDEALAWLLESLGGPADLVLSDMSGPEARRRVRRKITRGRCGQRTGRHAQTQFHQRQTCQAPRQPQGVV
jgi:23S rRNA (uridine2552-2'-O)-methyltransferase